MQHFDWLHYLVCFIKTIMSIKVKQKALISTSVTKIYQYKTGIIIIKFLWAAQFSCSNLSCITMLHYILWPAKSAYSLQKAEASHSDSHNKNLSNLPWKTNLQYRFCPLVRAMLSSAEISYHKQRDNGIGERLYLSCTHQISYSVWLSSQPGVPSDQQFR